MATLVKEKRREKKKSRNKNVPEKEAELPSLVGNLKLENVESRLEHITSIAGSHGNGGETSKYIGHTVENEETLQTEQPSIDAEHARVGLLTEENLLCHNISSGILISNRPLKANIDVEETSNCNLNNKEITNTIPKIPPDFETTQTVIGHCLNMEALEQNIMPSAPELEPIQANASVANTVRDQETVEIVKPKIQCMPLEEAIRVYGGKEIAEVKAMSEREEALVEAGPFSGPDHPLVDLLSTFKLSLTAVERERTSIMCKIAEEGNARLKLWRVEQRSVSVSQKCACGAGVELRAAFERAELLRERLPAARVRLQALLTDVQEAYCYHQHAALLAHCQIDDYISEAVESNKNAIREALALVLQALRLSDGAAEAYAQALQRWAGDLAAALVDERDLRHLLFLLHHLFRQTRSVWWAARTVRVGVSDSVSAARAIALLDLLLARPGLESALECTEEASLDAWEEVDVRGGAGAVEEGRLRERDLLALLDACPLHALLARLTLFARADVRSGSALEWGDASGGHGVRKACCGARALLDVLRRALLAHPAYTRLHARMRALAEQLLHALAALHLHSSPLYQPALAGAVRAELEACFAAGAALGGEPRRLPAGLLGAAAAREYCLALAAGLHDTTARRIAALDMDAPAIACEARVGAVAQAAVDRAADHELARTVLDFLLQTGIQRRAGAVAACGGRCATAARAELPALLAAHRHLHTTAFAVMADFNDAEPVDPAYIACLSPQRWRPAPPEMRAALDDWARRCPSLLPPLLAQLDYAPHEGLSLPTQLSIGSWLCGFVSAAPGEPEWCWAALRRLCVHRAQWGLPLDAPAPEPHDANDLFSAAYALLASEWGHCIPLACGAGAEALCRLAAARPADALHCAAPLMRLMAASPESVSYTPKFAEAFALVLNAGPSLVQRALGRARLSGAEQLQRLLVDQLSDPHIVRSPEASSALLSAWLHALWQLTLPAASRAILDAAVRACQQWATLDAHVAALLQGESGKEYVADAVRHAATAPLLCEAVLRAAHAREVRSHVHARLAAELWRQRAQGQRIHVDNALKQIGTLMSADELAGLRAAPAVLAAPASHPAHLQLWRLLLHVYLQRPPATTQETTAPIGPLLYSGLVKSRVLAQLKKRLQDSAAYHQRQAELLKTSPTSDTPPQRPARKNECSPAAESGAFPPLSIADLTGEAGGSGSEGEEEDDDVSAGAAAPPGAQPPAAQDAFHMICYHSAAEKLLREYARWLEEGERTPAAPHHADTARFIPHQAMDAAWRLSVPRPPPDSPATPPATGQPAGEPVASVSTLSHHERAVHILLSVKDNSHRRPRRAAARAPLAGVDLGDRRSLLARVDQLLADMLKLTQDWSSEVRYISKLDAQLWELVGALRVRRPLPPVSKACPQGCKPLTVRIPEDEWCISTGAQRGIQENRRSALAALRRLARARPHAARSVATLHCIARRVRSAEGALALARRAANCADGAAACMLARQALPALVADLAERWICQDGVQTAELVKSWSRGGDAQRALCGALVAPRRLPRAHWPAVYVTLLTCDLPPHAAFSYLSKFEMSSWAEAADAAQRRTILDALLAAARRLGPAPGDQHQVLLELLGVHLCAVVSPAEVCTCARAVAAPDLPPAFCAAIARAIDAHAARLTFDQLGHLQRELGALWWDSRTGGAAPPLASHAEHAASALRSLQRAFVAAAVALSYEPAAVAWYAWSALRESWGAWVTPHPAPPLLPSTGDTESYTAMLARFLDALHQVMEQCPGSEESLLCQVWQWAVQACVSASGPRAPQECRVQTSALLAELARLPWRRAWWHLDCLPLALQVVSAGERELSIWCARSWAGTPARAWLRGAADDALAPALAALLALFTSAHAPHDPQTLAEACELPWARLPGAALDEALERFYMEHYSPATPYHDAPQFVVVLAAGELRAGAGTGSVATDAASREKRACSVSRWVRAAAAPELHAHVRAHAASVLAVLAALAPHLEPSSGELEELLSRALSIMCMDAAAAALPVWEQWIARCAAPLRSACASAVATLTAVDCFAALADAVAKAQLADKESSGWAELRSRWAACAWAEGGALAARARTHAAYGALLARAHSPRDLANLFNALANNIVEFKENEAIVAVWICAACRHARPPAEQDGEAGAGAEGARALLARWGAEPRRTLLQVVALQAASGPTPQHRLLCKLAQCVLNRDEASAKAFEAACAVTPGAGDAAAAGWGRAPRPASLPRLAARLYPHHELYFREELQLAPDTP